MIVIIDYQMGNLRSVQKALERVGAITRISGDPADIAAAEKVVLPGVGAFPDAMHELTSRGLIDPIRECVAAGKPVLGICLGLQLLFDWSDEGGRHAGLGILPGGVVRFDNLPAEFKVPHMGWNTIDVQRDNPLLSDIASGNYFYFVHSYFVVPDDEETVALTASYHRPFCAMARRDNLFATQFHPEKSQSVGLRMLANFVAL